MRVRNRKGWAEPVPDLDNLEYIVDDYSRPPKVWLEYGDNTLFDHGVRLAPHEAFYSWGSFYVLVDENGNPWHLHDELTTEEQEAIRAAVTRCIEREMSRREQGLPLITAHQIFSRCYDSQERFKEMAAKFVAGELETLPEATPYTNLPSGDKQLSMGF